MFFVINLNVISISCPLSFKTQERNNCSVKSFQDDVMGVNGLSEAWAFGLFYLR